MTGWGKRDDQNRNQNKLVAMGTRTQGAGGICDYYVATLHWSLISECLDIVCGKLWEIDFV